MANILDSFRRLFKSRQHQRYVARDDTFVIISPSGSASQEQRVQLIDISKGGMAFIYQGSPAELETSGVLKLLAKTKLGEKINFDTVSDVPISDSVQTSEPFRRRGVKFKWMGIYAQSELSELIDKVKICEK